MNSYRFQVKGIPQAKGSTRAFVIKGRAVTTSTNKNLKGWEQSIREAVQDWPHGVLDLPFMVDLLFTFVKPVSAKKRLWPTVKPDLDKCIRATLDACTGILWRDDSQVYQILATKVYGPTTGLSAQVEWRESNV